MRTTANTRDHKNGQESQSLGAPSQSRRITSVCVCVDLFRVKLYGCVLTDEIIKTLFCFCGSGKHGLAHLEFIENPVRPEKTCGKSGVKIYTLTVICLSCTSVSRRCVKTSGGAEYIVTDTEYTGVVEVQVEENRCGEYS